MNTSEGRMCVVLLTFHNVKILVILDDLEDYHPDALLLQR